MYKNKELEHKGLSVMYGLNKYFQMCKWEINVYKIFNMMDAFLKISFKNKKVTVI